MSDLELLAPLSGWAVPLDEVDDEVFAARMLGDGVAIDPTEGTLRAPCAGEVTALPASAHAVSLRADAGAELLLHVGIDTVALKGEGFEALVREGQRVAAGEPLLTFDLDRIARGARSLVTPVIVTEPERYRIVERRSGLLVRAGDPLMTLREIAASQSSAPAGDTATGSLRISLSHGLHARPAAILAQAMRVLRAEATLTLRGKSANARSAVAMLSLGARQGDALALQATGEDAGLVRAALERALAHAASLTDAPARNATADRAPAQPAGVVIAAPGLAVGPVVQVAARIADIAERGAGEQVERRRLDEARARLAARLRRRAAASGGPAADILGAHLEFLDDPELVDSANRHVAAGASAGFAWRQSVDSAVRSLGSVDDARLRTRADDLRDLELQLQAELAGTAERTAARVPAGAILVARDLLPSQFMAFEASRIAGICTVSRAATSHVSILAGAHDLPMLVGVEESLLDVPEGTTVIVDAERGQVGVDPRPAAIAEARSRIAERDRARAQLRAAAALDCRTADGERVAVWANIGSAAEAAAAVVAGAEGCGLLRTEFLFLDRREPPDAEEQRAHYQAIVDAMDGRPVVVRTLDAGSDKPIPFLEMPPQDNPALGLRGIRASLWRPDLLRTQLAAILGTRPVGRCRILLPMVNESAEIEAVRGIVREIAGREVGSADIEIGIMIETPAAAVNASRLAAHADFLSIGTNDLTQYVLAIDRTHPTLSRALDALHPAVLRLIESVCAAARGAGRPVAVCGGLASEAVVAPLLVGLGVGELSAMPGAIPAIKAALRPRTLAECRELAGRALDAADAAAVRAILADFEAGRAP
ncbi:MAG TPA: phosphoenolpyruvate--protein phosphotransferase [Steroidobacteraceae bacterium]|nr:phosphoenolpyruvate--protein phosphotransferase [Steroidobacteraceae bacterium]